MTQESADKPTRARVQNLTKILRQRILDGKWELGAKIPTKIQLCHELGASDGTVQKTLDNLTTHGFLRSRGCLGTFVVERPPHLFRIGLVTANRRGSSIWLDALSTMAEQLAQNERRWLHVYSDCHVDQGKPSRALQELADDLQHARLAGLILVCGPDALGNTPALHQPGLTRVILGAPFPSYRFPAIGSRPTHPRAMQYFQKQGRHRLGIITTFHYRNQIEPILQCAREHGLATARTWVHFMDERTPYPARTVTELLMSLPGGKRPDALYINDDHLVTEAAGGVADAGVRVPQDLTIVAHANFPAIQPTAAPVTYLGYDSATLLRTALGLLDQLRAGQKAPDVIWLDPVFDFERVPPPR